MRSKQGNWSKRKSELARLRKIRRCRTAKEAGEALGLTAQSVREWLCRDPDKRLAVAVRYAEAEMDRRRKRLLEHFPTADVRGLRKLEAELYVPWVVKYGRYYSLAFGGFGAG